MTETTHNPRECAQSFLEEALDKHDIEQEIKHLLKTPHRTVEVELPLRRDNGQLTVYVGFRVQHDDSRGPFKGGLRYHPELDAAHSQGLASLMTWKTSLANIPMGGAKGGINCNPHELSAGELERLTKQFVTRIAALIGPVQDIPAPDVGTGGREMAWIYDAYTAIYGHHPDMVTGKPLGIGGSKGRVEATGYGLSLITNWACRNQEIDIDGATIAIQGFGNVGSYVAQFLSDKGAKVVAVSDVGGGVYNKNGLDIRSLVQKTHVDGQQVQSVTESQVSAEAISNDELLTADVDVLIPAALGAAINASNVKDVRARIVIEAANLPVTCDADTALSQRGVFVVPDILANSGGVIVSYLEWVQNRQGLQWSQEDVLSYLTDQLDAAWSATVQRMSEENTSCRRAAYLIATQRVIETKMLRGFQF